MKKITKQIISKIPEVTIGFWIIKILCTTLGETGGDAVTMTWGMGYLTGSIIFITALVLLVIAQVNAKKFHPTLYWATIIASTTAGTTMADFADRSLGIGYTGGSFLLLVLLIGSLVLWKWVCGTVSFDSITSKKAEIFYWVTITFSQTLGTALGDWMADTNDFGYMKASLVFGGALTIIAILYYKTKISRVALFWLAFILTRPLGATVGDLLDKPLASGGLDVSRPVISLVLLIAVVLLIAILPQRAGKHPNYR